MTATVLEDEGFSTEASVGTNGSRPSRVCTFRVGDIWFGLDVSDVQEVLRAQPLTPIPGAPGVVEGLLNLRGEIVVALDTRRRIDPAAVSACSESVVVVLRPDRYERTSLLVDEVGDAIDVTDLQLEAVPDTATRVPREVLLGAYQQPECLLVLLNTAALVAGSF